MSETESNYATARTLLYSLLDFVGDNIPIPGVEWGRQYWILDGAPRVLVDTPEHGKAWLAPKDAEEYEDDRILEKLNFEEPVHRATITVTEHPDDESHAQIKTEFTPPQKPDSTVHLLGALAVQYISGEMYTYPNRFLIITGNMEDKSFGWRGFRGSKEKESDAIRTAEQVAQENGDRFWQVVDMKNKDIVREGKVDNT